MYTKFYTILKMPSPKERRRSVGGGAVRGVARVGCWASQSPIKLLSGKKGRKVKRKEKRGLRKGEGKIQKGKGQKQKEKKESNRENGYWKAN